MELTQEYSNKGIVLFDGVCNLCNASVQFIIKRDKKDFFRFASLQSDTGAALLKSAGLPAGYLTSILYIENGRHYKESTAALKIAKNLPGAWPLLYVFIVIPAFIRNFFYRIIAANRYRWFGQKNECMIPSPDLKQKFI